MREAVWQLSRLIEDEDSLHLALDGGKDAPTYEVLLVPDIP